MALASDNFDSGETLPNPPVGWNTYGADWGTTEAANGVTPTSSPNMATWTGGAAGAGWLTYGTEIGQADVVVQCNVSVYADAQPGLMGVTARGSAGTLGPASTFYVAWIDAYNADVVLGKNVGGTFTTLGSVSYGGIGSGWPGWVTLYLTCLGSTISLAAQQYSNGEWLTSGGSWQAGQATAITQTDSAIAGNGYAGLYTGSTGAAYDAYFDNWAVDPAGTGPARASQQSGGRRWQRGRAMVARRAPALGAVPSLYSSVFGWAGFDLPVFDGDGTGAAPVVAPSAGPGHGVLLASRRTAKPAVRQPLVGYQRPAQQQTPAAVQYRPVVAGQHPPRRGRAFLPILVSNAPWWGTAVPLIVRGRQHPRPGLAEVQHFAPLATPVAVWPVMVVPFGTVKAQPPRRRPGKAALTQTTRPITIGTPLVGRVAASRNKLHGGRTTAAATPSRVGPPFRTPSPFHGELSAIRHRWRGGRTTAGPGRPTPVAPLVLPARGLVVQGGQPRRRGHAGLIGTDRPATPGTVHKLALVTGQHPPRRGRSLTEHLPPPQRVARVGVRAIGQRPPRRGRAGLVGTDRPVTPGTVLPLTIVRRAQDAALHRSLQSRGKAGIAGTDRPATPGTVHRGLALRGQRPWRGGRAGIVGKPRADTAILPKRDVVVTGGQPRHRGRAIVEHFAPLAIPVKTSLVVRGGQPRRRGRAGFVGTDRPVTPGTVHKLTLILGQHPPKRGRTLVQHLPPPQRVARLGLTMRGGQPRRRGRAGFVGTDRPVTPGTVHKLALILGQHPPKRGTVQAPDRLPPSPYFARVNTPLRVIGQHPPRRGSAAVKGVPRPITPGTVLTGASVRDRGRPRTFPHGKAGLVPLMSTYQSWLGYCAPQLASVVH